MNKEEEHIDQCSAARVIGTGTVSPAQINASIAAALGFIVEIQDGIVKCWDREKGMPDETNWVPGLDFAGREVLTLVALAKREIPVSTLPSDTGGWVCSFELNGERLSTFPQPEEACALALALYHIICHDY